MKSGEFIFLFKLAWKNLARHKRRTAITAIALAIGLMMFILMDSLLAGMFEQSNNNLKNAETGDGKIISAEAFDDLKFLPLNNRIKDPDLVISIVEELGGRASKRILANGDMIYTDEFFPLSYTGLDFSSVAEDIDMGMSFIIYPQLNIKSTVLVFIYSLFVSSFISFFPSKSASKVDPVEALRDDYQILIIS